MRNKGKEARGLESIAYAIFMGVGAPRKGREGDINLGVSWSYVGSHVEAQMHYFDDDSFLVASAFAALQGRRRRRLEWMGTRHYNCPINPSIAILT